MQVGNPQRIRVGVIVAHGELSGTRAGAAASVAPLYAVEAAIEQLERLSRTLRHGDERLQVGRRDLLCAPGVGQLCGDGRDGHHRLAWRRWWVAGREVLAGAEKATRLPMNVLVDLACISSGFGFRRWDSG